jgi:hypothetical protein
VDWQGQVKVQPLILEPDAAIKVNIPGESVTEVKYYFPVLINRE